MSTFELTITFCMPQSNCLSSESGVGCMCSTSHLKPYACSQESILVPNSGGGTPKYVWRHSSRVHWATLTRSAGICGLQYIGAHTAVRRHSSRIGIALDRLASACELPTSASFRVRRLSPCGAERPACRRRSAQDRELPGEPRRTSSALAGLAAIATANTPAWEHGGNAAGDGGRPWEVARSTDPAPAAVNPAGINICDQYRV
jgi:hypothetical protein